MRSYTQRNDSFALPETAITFALDEIYEGVEIPEDLRLLPEPLEE